MRRIRYRLKRNAGVWGLAFPHQNRIEVDPDLDDRTMLDICIHEALHVLFEDLCEESVNNAGISISDLLWRLGYRRIEEE